MAGSVVTVRPTDVDPAERPIVLIWEVTQACDLACKHCRAEADACRHPDELTTAAGKHLLDEATGFGDDQLVVLSGGDPLFRDDLTALVEYGTEQGLRMTLTPSGTASLTPDRIDRLVDAGLRRMAVSLDGPDSAAHDEFRQETGSFEQTMAAARTARERGLPLQVNTTVCAETVDSLPAIRDLVAEMDAVLWSVFFLVPVGRGTVLDPISAARAEEVMEWLATVQREADFGIKTTEAPHFRRVALQQRQQGSASRPPGGRPDVSDGDRSAGGDRSTGITAGNGFAFVSHTGEVFPSGFLPESAGNVRETSIVDIYRHSDLFERLRDPDALAGKCGACEFRYVCGGSRSRAFARTGDPLASDPLCAYVPDGYDGPLPEGMAETVAD
ncbi:MAG: TIGR04053 family radical SAM/SPASM domain-containing protein [Halococcoides sp.]